MGAVFILEDVNLICGDTGGTGQQPGTSTHLTLAELKLPAMEENFVDHIPGGAPVGIEIPTHFARLEASFILVGMHPEVLTMIAQSYYGNQGFTAYGLLRDRMTGRALQAKAYMEGRLGRANPTNFRRGDAHRVEYAIRGLVRYTFQMMKTPDGALEQIWNWDFATNTLEIGGINVNAEINRYLNTGGPVGGGLITA